MDSTFTLASSSKNKTKKNFKKHNNNNNKTLYLHNRNKKFNIQTDDDIEQLYLQSSEHVHNNACEICNSELFNNENGLLVCSNPLCAKLYTNTIDFGAEWRYYGADDSGNVDPTRCGMPIDPYMVESSFSCKVANSSTSSYNMKKIRRYVDWQAVPYHEKSIYNDFNSIKRHANNANIPEMIINCAMSYYHKISGQTSYRGLNREGILAASLYIAFKVNNVPRTARDIAEIFKLNTRSATAGCKNIMEIIEDMDNDNPSAPSSSNISNTDVITMSKSVPIDFIERYCSKLQLSEQLTKLCTFIAYQVEKHNLIPENAPKSIATGIIYYVSILYGTNILKQDINKVSDISEVTIIKCYRKLEACKEQIIPKQILCKLDPTYTPK